MWIDTHCHLDAPEFDPDRDAVWARAVAAGVSMLVIPAVRAADFDAVQALAHRIGACYALGIHPLCADAAGPQDLQQLDAALHAARDDPLLVAVGEIGLDHLVAGVHDTAARTRQREVYEAQLQLARAHGLPVILHVRRSADALLAGVRRHPVAGGLAHAFNGSAEQAQAFVQAGFALGFGGAMTHERALQIRRLASALPDTALVLETDAPDIPPQWLYRTATARRDGSGHLRNEPAELPRIAHTLAHLRGWSLERTADQTSANAVAALPRLAAWAERAALPHTAAAPSSAAAPHASVPHARAAGGLP